ncbi:MAG: tetratricopeptide repeat protein [Candidatus Nealsonbacteria bacterium]|nr:tetratricopeptide repeat protein [Candidatus Nealsonbacteria bacterium]
MTRHIHTLVQLFLLAAILGSSCLPEFAWGSDATNDPSAAAHLNNQGAESEDSGDFAEAAGAYHRALTLDPDNEDIRNNLRRVHVRKSLIPLAALSLIVLVIIGCFLLIRWIIRIITDAIDRARRRFRYRKVRLGGIVKHARTTGGDTQPDGYVYFDTTSLTVTATISMPSRKGLYPLALALEIVKPDGTVHCTVENSVAAYPGRSHAVGFEVPDVDVVLQSPGRWRANLFLSDVKLLGETAFTVVGRSQLIDDLAVRDVSLIATQGEEVRETSLVLTDVESVVPHAVVVPKTYHPSKFDGLELIVTLVHHDTAFILEETAIPFDPSSGRMELLEHSVTVANGPIEERTGRWDFRLSVEGRKLPRQISFLLVTSLDLQKSIFVERIDIVGRTASGQCVSVGDSGYIPNIQSLTPVVTVRTQYPTPDIEHPVLIGVCVDGKPVEEVDTRIVLGGPISEFIPGEYNLPGERPQGPTVYSFVIFMHGQCLATRDVRLIQNMPSCANAQGQLDNEWADTGYDFDREAEAILQHAHVA